MSEGHLDPNPNSAAARSGESQHGGAILTVLWITDSRFPLVVLSWELSRASLTRSFLFSYQTVLYLRGRDRCRSPSLIGVPDGLGLGPARGGNSRIFHVVQLLRETLDGVVAARRRLTGLRR